MASFAILCEKAGPKGCIIIIRKSHRTSKSFRRNDTEKDIKNLVDRHVVVLLGIGVSTFFKVNGSIGSDKIQLRLAHGQAGDSEIGGTIAYLSDLVAEDESMNMEVSIYPSGVLGSETAMVELV